MHTFHHCKVVGISAAVPKQIINNATDHPETDPEETEKTISLTGIQQYRKASDNICASDLCFAAANQLLEASKIERESIDAIIFVSQTTDYRAPSTACILQDKLNLGVNTIAYDINLGCSGYLYGIYTLCSMIEGGGVKRALLLAGDTQTKFAHPKDKHVNFIMADAGTATLLEFSDNAEPIAIDLKTDGSRFQKLYIPSGGARHPSTPETLAVTEQADGQLRSQEHMVMVGMDIFTFSVTDAVKTIKTFMAEQEKTPENTNYLILHQANKFMTDKIGRKLKFSPNQVLYSLDIYGNTSCASIPLTLVRNQQNLINQTTHNIISGFGIGLSWGVATLPLDQTVVMPPITEVTHGLLQAEQ